MTTTQKVANRIAKDKFTTTWSTTTVDWTRDRFHPQIQVGYHAHPLGYKGINLGLEHKHIK
jgi:hypothetical protein